MWDMSLSINSLLTTMEKELYFFTPQGAPGYKHWLLIQFYCNLKSKPCYPKCFFFLMYLKVTEHLFSIYSIFKCKCRVTCWKLQTCWRRKFFFTHEFFTYERWKCANLSFPMSKYISILTPERYLFWQWGYTFWHWKTQVRALPALVGKKFMCCASPPI